MTPGNWRKVASTTQKQPAAKMAFDMVVAPLLKDRLYWMREGKATPQIYADQTKTHRRSNQNPPQIKSKPTADQIKTHHRDTETQRKPGDQFRAFCKKWGNNRQRMGDVEGKATAADLRRVR